MWLIKLRRYLGFSKLFQTPLRLKILALCLTKERTVRELCKILKVSKPLLISHLKKLIEVELIEYKTEIDSEKPINTKNIIGRLRAY